MMETENTPVNLPTHHIVHQGLSILCSLCDIAFYPGESKTNICPKCILDSADITVGITKEGIINYCKYCHRYLRPPWSLCERESKELLSICLKRLRGLSKVKIIDAAFVYTDPSSRRVKVRLTIQKEVFNNTNVQQSFVCEFIEHYQQCDDCKKEFTPHTWGAAVQIRQKIGHKKTFFYLEQLLLKNCANDKVLKIERVDDGLDFFYKTRSHAVNLVDFLDSVLPIRIKQSKQLVSHDMSSNSYYYKYVYGVELPKICKDDLVVIPLKLQKELGGVNQMQLCYKITNIIHLIDPLSLKCSELSIEKYSLYEPEFVMMSLRSHGSPFTVIDSEKVSNTNLNESYVTSTFNRFIDRIYQVQLIRESGDFTPITTKTFMGDILKPGTTVLGFDVAKLSLDEIDAIKNRPDIVLVRRQIDKDQKRKRIFKLKRLEQENQMDEEGVSKRKNKKDLQKDDDEYEEFLEDVDKDKEMRKNMILYRDEKAIAQLTDKERKQMEKLKPKQVKGRKIIKVPRKEGEVVADDDWQSADGDSDDNEVKLEELMRDLTITDNRPDTQSQLNEDQSNLDDFISKMDKIKIENK